MTSRRHAVATLVCAALLGAAGCGDDAQDARVVEERIAAAREEAARQASLDEKTKAQETEQRRLKRELARLRRERERDRDGQGAGAGSAPAGGGTSTPASGGGTSCGGGLSVGPNTTCAFARNVREAYLSSGRSSPVSVYSPVTGQTYSMSCTSGATTVCTGGNNASVYF
jgi:hypothetical protein